MDGMLLVTPECYEPTAVAAMRSWFAETGRQVHACGPLLPASSKETAKEHERKHAAESSAIEEFLDATLKVSGPRSLLYVRACASILPPKSSHTLLDFFGYHLLADRETPEYVDRPRCGHGTQHPLRASIPLLAEASELIMKLNSPDPKPCFPLCRHPR